MKNKKDYIFLLVAVLNIVIISLVSKVLENFNWYLRGWVYWITEAIVFLLIFIFIAQRFRHTKSIIKKVFVTILAIIYILFSFLFFIFSCWVIEVDYIKMIDNEKYIGIEEDQFRARVFVYYYKKYNFVAYYKSKEHIVEFYNNTRTIFNRYPDDVTYYDENGEIVKNIPTPSSSSIIKAIANKKLKGVQKAIKKLYIASPINFI